MRVCKLKISQLRCTAAQAAIMTYPRALGNLCQALNTEHKKDELGKKIMLKFAKPRKPTKNNSEIWFENFATIEDKQTLINYNRDDVLAESACDEKLLPMSRRELALFHMTLEMNARGLNIDLKLIKIAWSFVLKFMDEKKIELMALTKGEVTGAKQVQRIHKWLKIFGLTLPNLQADTVEETLRRNDIPAKALKLLELRQALAGSATSKYLAMLNAVCPDGRIRGYLVHHAATTGRWSSRGVQVHNFIKLKSKAEKALVPHIIDCLSIGDYETFKMIFPDVQKTLAMVLRSMLIPSKGKEFYDLDWSAIEARIVNWLAGDMEGLDTYHKGEDPYKKFVSRLFEKDIDAVTDVERQNIGKPGELGCGFGMGWEKASVQFNMPPILAHKVVKTYRELHKPVKKFWRTLIEAAVEAVENPGKIVLAGEHIQYLYKNNMLMCRLPCGRKLYYLHPKVSISFKKVKIKTPVEQPDGSVKIHVELKQIKTRQLVYVIYKGAFPAMTRTYSGHQCENVTQATARSIIAAAMLRSRKEFDHVLCLHDEGLIEIDKGTDKFERFKEIYSMPNKWADGLPLKVEGWINTRFGSY